MAVATSYLGLEDQHAFITGAGGGIGSAAVQAFLENNCYVTAFDIRQFEAKHFTADPKFLLRLFVAQGDMTSAQSLNSALDAASAKFGPPNILIANAGITDESLHPPIWEVTEERWQKVYDVNIKGTFLSIKHFLQLAKKTQEAQQAEIPNLSIVLTGSETGVFGQEGHSEYASGKAGLQYGLVKTVKNEIVRLNRRARINAIAPSWVDTPLIGDRLDDPKELWAECHATAALRKIAQPRDVASSMVFLASQTASGHISGQCLSCDGGMEGRLIWREAVGALSSTEPRVSVIVPSSPTITRPISRPRRMRICLSVDFDAISGYLGTGHMPQNTLADHSSGVFSANVGVGRLLSMFGKHGISSQLTWFIPGHTIETFPDQVASIVKSGAEIGLHGYSHESACAMTPEQENDVLEKCIRLISDLKDGAQPVGWRAPLYQIRESTVDLLQKYGFLYDSSMNAHDSLPYTLRRPFLDQGLHVPDYTKPASSWMKPSSIPREPAAGSKEALEGLVEIPSSWYTEDMTPLGFYPYSCSSHGYVATDVVEKMWWDRFLWLWENESFTDRGPGLGYGCVYPLCWHPESAGRSHIIGMIDRFIARLVAFAGGCEKGQITFETMADVARSWKSRSG